MADSERPRTIRAADVQPGMVVALRGGLDPLAVTHVEPGDDTNDVRLLEQHDDVRRGGLFGADQELELAAPVSMDAPMVLDFNHVVDQVRAWLTAAYPAQQSLSGGWEVTLTDEVGNPWLHVDGRPQMPYERGEFPAEVSFAVLRTTGAVHLVIAGEVQDPALEVPA